MENLKITHAKIVDDLFLEVKYTEDLPGHSKKKIKNECTVPVHKDLKDAFGKLDKHLALLCDGLDNPTKVKDIDQWDAEDLKKFSVFSFTISGHDETEGVTLSGNKEGRHGTINLNTPLQKWETSKYKHISPLQATIEDCIFEVEEYLFNGKKAPDQQIEMDFEDSTPEEKPKSKGKLKLVPAGDQDDEDAI